LKGRDTLFFSIIAAVLLFIFSSIPAFAGSATLSWNPPTRNTDGTPLTDLAGFKIYYGISSGNYTQVVNAGYVTTYTVNNLNSGTYYFVATAYDTSGNESGYSNQVSKTISGGTSQQYSLAVAKGGTGSGTVTSSPSGISCGSSCSASYNSGSVVRLTVSPASGSVFSSWSGACVGNGGQCTVTMNSNTAVTANFAVYSSQTSGCSGPPVMIARSGQYYSTIQAAYNAAREGDVIQIQAVELTGDIDIYRNISITFSGGYDCDFSGYVQNSVINGMLVLDGGSFIADSIDIQ
jgi:hypothetical protein